MPECVVVLGNFAESLVRFRGRLIADLVHRGHRVVAVAPDLNAEVKRALSALGAEPREIPMRRVSLNPLSDLMTLLALIRLLREIRPDCLLSYTIKPIVYGSLAARIAGVERCYSLVTGLGYSFTSGKGLARSFSGAAARHLYRAALRLNQHIFFQNSDDLDLLRRLSVVSSAASTSLVNGSGVDIQEFSFAPPPPNGGFLMIARLVRDKGVREYAAAARMIRARFPTPRFRLIGWIDENPSAISKHELDAWILDGTIDFLGQVADVRPALRQCSVYVLPSYREGTPRTVLEAMAIGRAIVTTDAPGCRETVRGGVNGVLVPVGDARALAEAMMRFLEQPALIEDFGRASRALAESRFDVRSVSAAMIRVMRL